MFNKFPREVGPPRKVVYNIKEWTNFVNKYNGMKMAVYTSIYVFENIYPTNKPDYNSAIVDKLFFDFDDKSCNSYEECKKLSNFLIQENIRHFIIMSGRGYHLYISTPPLKPENIKSCIYNAQHYFIDKLNLTVDPQVIGNPAQLARVPNTYNQKGKRFCIPLTKIQFEMGDEKIKQLAEKQNFVNDISIGEKLFDISKLDYKSDNIETFNFKNDNLGESPNTEYFISSPDMIKSLLVKKELGWNDRFLVIMYFKEKGYSQKEVFQILKENLTERKFVHCVHEERQLQYLFERDDLLFPDKYGVTIYK